MERMNETNELEEMRAQMALLQEKLNKEEILTDSLLKQIIPDDPGHTITLCGGAWKTHRLMYDTNFRLKHR